MVSKVYNNVFAMFIQKIYHGYLTSMLDDKGMFLSSLSGIKKIIILVLFVFGHFQGLKAQFVEFGFNLSGNTYQGDISPLTWRLSMQGANFAYGLNAGYHFNKYLSLKISYNLGSIEADDKYAVDKWRRDRNLNFRTDIREWALTADVFFLEYLKFFRKYDLKPYLKTGVALFSFNPQGLYKGKWYDLQPLGTEGQGLSGSDKQPYDLTQIAIPFGFGLCYDINRYIRVGFEISPRITFTDYLDDVSTEYPDFEKLLKERGQMAVNLSYKGDLLPGGIEPEEIINLGRGNSKDNDWYVFTSFTFSVLFDPVYENIKRKTFNGARKCTF